MSDAAATATRQAKTAGEFSIPIRVYWEDTDAGGVVYHSVYLNFLERARSEWLRHLGLDQVRLREKEQILFVVVDMTIQWIKPARFDDLLAASIGAVNVKGATVLFDQGICRAGELLMRAQVRVAVIDALHFRPVRIPAAVLSVLRVGG